MPPRLMCFALITRMAVNTVFHRVINSVFNTFQHLRGVFFPRLWP